MGNDSRDSIEARLEQVQEALHDVECGAEVEAALEKRDDPLLRRALRRIRALEVGIEYADSVFKKRGAELARIRKLVFPESLPLDDALYLAIKEKFEGKN